MPCTDAAADMEAEREKQTKFRLMEQMLCFMCSSAEKVEDRGRNGHEGLGEFLRRAVLVGPVDTMQYRLDMSANIRVWWQNHQKEDAAGAAVKARQERREKVLRELANSLTEEQLSALEHDSKLRRLLNYRDDDGD